MKRERIVPAICGLAIMVGTVFLPQNDLNVRASQRESVQEQMITDGQEEKESYLFVYFTGDETAAEHEQLYFSASRDGNHWVDLNENKPVLVSEVGERGVRDPFILRSAEGDKFYILATDLSIYNRSLSNPQDPWEGTVTAASKNMVVWESADLVHWENCRLVDMASKIPGAGCVWAPEAIYDEQMGMYVVYWATFSEESNALGDGQNIYCSTTKDFRTFTEPVLWIDCESPILDTTMICVDGTYYRASAADEQIRIDRCSSIFGEWEKVGTLEGIFNNKKYSGNYLEGPELFEYCKDDWLTDSAGSKVRTFGLMCDRFKEKKGYLPFRSTNLSDGAADSWSVADDVDFGEMKKRHGSIIAITGEEYARIMDSFGEKPVFRKSYREIFPDDLSQSVQEEIVADGGFEKKLTSNGWNFSDTGIWYAAGNYSEPSEKEGKKAPGVTEGGIYQKVYLEAGKTYELQMELNFTGTPSGSGIGIYGCKGDNSQYTGKLAYGYDSLSMTGIVDGTLDFAKKNEWQTMRGNFSPSESGYYFIGLWGGNSGNTIYAANISCIKKGEREQELGIFKVSESNGLILTCGKYTGTYTWSELLGENYDKSQKIKLIVTGVAEGKTVTAEAWQNKQEPPVEEQKPPTQEDARLKTTTKVTASQLADKCHVKVTFAKVSGAQGYDIYRSTKLSSGYRKIGTTKKTAYTDKSVKASKTYYYKVVAKSTKKENNSMFSKKYGKVTVLAKPKGNALFLKAGRVTVSWKKVKGAKGYVIYASANKSRGYRNVSEIKKATVTEKIVKVPKKWKKIYVKIRPYNIIKGKRAYGTYSSPISCKLKK